MWLVYFFPRLGQSKSRQPAGLVAYCDVLALSPDDEIDVALKPLRSSDCARREGRVRLRFINLSRRRLDPAVKNGNR
jgi:hypothetical protein